MFRVALILALVAGCGNGASTLTASPAALTDERAAHLDALFAADAAHAADVAQLGPVDGVIRAMRGNVVYLAAGVDVITGRREVKAAVEAANPDPANTSLSLTTAGGDVSADGNFGFTFGWLERAAAEGVTYGTYLAIWEREREDDFRITAYYTRSAPFPHIPPRAGFPLFLGGAGAGGVPHPGSVEGQRRSLSAADEAFSAQSVAEGTGIAFPAWANPDFMMAFGRNFVGLVGEAEIAGAYGVSVPGEVLQWAPVWASASGSGDLGVTVGKAIDTLTLADGSVTRTCSKYLTLWVRRADGSWRFIADGGSPSPAP
ncbi:MAG TPA: hypothetical protein VFL36_14235 [Myxococcales bacterium]|nr:hypothetical protein [Myxococcales bacterium]